MLYTIRLDKGLRKQLDSYAKENDLSAAQVVRRAIKDYLKNSPQCDTAYHDVSQRDTR